MAKSKERILTKKEVIQGTTWQPGTSIKLNDEGNLEKVVLGADQKIMDVHYAASMLDVFKKSTVIEYWGAMKAFNKKSEVADKIVLQEKHVIFGFPIPADTSLVPYAGFHDFDEAANDDDTFEVGFMQIQLGAPAVFKKKKFDAGEYVRIYPGNKIVYQGTDGEDKEL
jgi:hypothetical protein